MAKLMRCITPHWQGNTYIGLGTIRPEGHPEVIPIFFEAYVTDEPEPPPKPTSRLKPRT